LRRALSLVPARADAEGGPQRGWLLAQGRIPRLSRRDPPGASWRLETYRCSPLPDQVPGPPPERSSQRHLAPAQIVHICAGYRWRRLRTITEQNGGAARLGASPVPMTYRDGCCLAAREPCRLGAADPCPVRVGRGMCVVWPPVS